MLELGLDAVTPLSDFKGDKNMAGSKPCLMFQGQEWDAEPYQSVRSVLIDLFRGRVVTSINLCTSFSLTRN